MRASQAVVVALSVLIATACVPDEPAGSQTSPPPSVTTASSASPFLSPVTAVLGEERSLATPCISNDGGAAESDALYWLGCTFETIPATSEIFSYARPSGPTTIAYRAREGYGISLPRISETWVAWVEYSDRSAAKDAKLYAMPRRGGRPTLIDDSTAHGPLAQLMDIALKGADLYWTLPVIEAGRWHGRLMHRHLDDGPTTVTEQAPWGSILGWPSAFNGTLAYEVSSETEVPQTRVVIRAPDGQKHETSIVPSSEPALGDGFLAFKSSERYSTGGLTVMRFSDGRLMQLGPGEAAVARGQWLTWTSAAPLDGALMLARPQDTCVYRLGDNRDARKAFPHLGPDVLTWTWRNAGIAELHFAPLNDLAPCSWRL